VRTIAPAILSELTFNIVDIKQPSAWSGAAVVAAEQALRVGIDERSSSCADVND
jgi:hypothetical protein